jgi:hypothetical protein
MTSRIGISVAAMAVLLLAGCASTYIISTTGGTMIESHGKPKLNSKTGMYEYEDTNGKDATIKADQVKQIIER